MVAAVSSSHSRAATVVLPGPPSGFSKAPAGLPPGRGVGGDILDGFSLSATTSGTYDSNVTQSSGLPGSPVQDDFILRLGVNLNYLSKGGALTFGGNYQGSYNQYFNQSDFSGYTQSGGLTANYDGGKFSASLNLGLAFDRGSNRYYSTAGSSAPVERTSINAGLTASYRLSPKVSLQGSYGQNFSTASGGEFDDTKSFDLGASALWKYSPLTEFGPGIRYTSRSGGRYGDRTSIGPTLTVNYKLSSKVSLNSRIGMEFASYEDGGSSDPSVSASVGLKYEASKLWGMNFTLNRDTQSDPVSGGFTEVTALRLGYHRKIRRATLDLGIGYEMNRSETSGGQTDGARSARNHFNLDGSLGMAVFHKTTFASVFFRYSEQSGSPRDSWDSVQMGFSLSRSF